MSNLIGEAGNTQSTTTGPVTTPAGTEAVDSGSSVTSGFSAKNSVSQTEGASSGASQSGVSLDNTSEAYTSSRTFLQQVFQSRLEGFRSAVSYFNAQLSSGQIDLSDTQTLLLVFRGMISDIKALNNAEDIDLVAAERLFLQGQRSEIANIMVQVPGNQVAIDAKSLELQAKQQALSSKQSVNTEGMSDAEKAQLQSEIDTLQAEIASLSGEVATLVSQNQALLAQIAVRQALLVLVENEEFVIKAFAFTPVKSNGEEELETGEEKLDELERELQELEALFSREELLAKLTQQILSDFTREVVREDDRYIENIQPRGFDAEQKELLNPQLIADLFRFFSVQDTSSLAALSNQGAPTEQELAEAAEGLALILFAEPSVTGSEENPVDQPYLGDSLSLEGANNPQAFTLLLLKERLADIREAIASNPDKVVTDSAGTNPLAQLFELERQVDAMVAEAIQDQEFSEAAISKSQPV